MNSNGTADDYSYELHAVTFCIPLLKNHTVPLKPVPLTSAADCCMRRVTGDQHIWLGEESVNTAVIPGLGRIPAKVELTTKKRPCQRYQRQNTSCQFNQEHCQGVVYFLSCLNEDQCEMWDHHSKDIMEGWWPNCWKGSFRLKFAILDLYSL